MKLFEITYYISVTICSLLLFLYLIRPFGGILGFYYMLRDGLFVYQVGFRVIYLDSPPYRYIPAAQNLQLMNSLITIVYFVMLITCVLSLFTYKKNPMKKYKLGIISFIASLILIKGGSLLWSYLVKSYLRFN